MVCKSVKRVCMGHSGKKAVLSLFVCSMLFALSGCGSGIADAYEDSYKEEASARIFNGESGYYDDYTAEREGAFSETAAEGTESKESIEKIEMIDTVDIIETMDSPIVDNWPESIAFVSKGTTAQPYSVSISIEEPMELSVFCIKDEGKIGMRITNADGKVYFEEKKMQTESYTVMIDRAGEYTFAFYAREYYGKLTIKPAE